MKKLNWKRILKIVTAVFAAGGIWYQQGMDKAYPELTQWFALAIPVLMLVIETYQNDEKKGNDG